MASEALTFGQALGQGRAVEDDGQIPLGHGPQGPERSTSTSPPTGGQFRDWTAP